MSRDDALIPTERIEQAILSFRGQKVMLDVDLAILYRVETKQLNRAVRRNLDRFPEDFMFQLTREEFDNLRYQFGTSKGRGGRRYLPYAFTEQGVAMLSSVLNSKRAIRVNVEIMRAFVRLRQILASHADLARKLDALEKKYDAQFRVVFEAIRQLMQPPPRAGLVSMRNFMTSQRRFDFLGSPGGIAQSFADVCFFQVRISLEDFRKRVTAGDQADERADRHAHAADAGLAAHDLGIERDAGELGHGSSRDGQWVRRCDNRGYALPCLIRRARGQGNYSR